MKWVLVELVVLIWYGYRGYGVFWELVYFIYSNKEWCVLWWDWRIKGIYFFRNSCVWGILRGFGMRVGEEI